MKLVKRYRIIEVIFLTALFMGLLLLQQPKENLAGASAVNENIVGVLDFIASEQPHK